MLKRAFPGEWDTLPECTNRRRLGYAEEGQSLITQSAQSKIVKTYSQLYTTGHARVHAGDVYNFTRDDAPGIYNPDSFSNALLRAIGCVVILDSRVTDLLSLTLASRSKDLEIQRWLEILTDIHNELHDRANADLESGQAIAPVELETADHAGFLMEAVSKLSSFVRSRTTASDLDQQRRKVRDLCDVMASVLLDTLKQSAGHYNHSYDGLLASEMSATVRVAFSLFQQAKVTPLLSKLGEDMHRARKVLDPFPDTYHWALERDDAGLKSWFQSGKGIYWITGKPGSGKSTLMKFLIASSGHLLADWAGGQRWVIASLFFWYAGTPLQKSVAGLFRSLIYQLLRSNRTLADIAFPRWHPNQVPWTVPELTNALQNVIDSAPLSLAAERFCFFIDGLDEYSGVNHMELIGIVQDLAKSQRVKLCISSRPLYAYRLAFETSVPHLYLENLNANDVHVYVSGHLTDASAVAENDASSLIPEVVDGSEGVFIWVVLVVESILEGLAEGEPIDFIRHRINEFPHDLGAFFQAILQRVSPSYKTRSGQALKLAWLSIKSSEHHVWIPNITDYWLISQHPQGIHDPAFAYQLPSETIALDKAALIVDETKRLLSAATKGLLMLNEADRRVEFIHRTVHEFLDSAEMTVQTDDSVPEHFKSKDMLHLLNITRMKLFLPRNSQQESLSEAEDLFGGIAEFLILGNPVVATQRRATLSARHPSTKFPEHHDRVEVESDDIECFNIPPEQYAIEFERAAKHVCQCVDFRPLERTNFHSLSQFMQASADEISRLKHYIYKPKRRTSSKAASLGEDMEEHPGSNADVFFLDQALDEVDGLPAVSDELIFKDYIASSLQDYENAQEDLDHRTFGSSGKTFNMERNA